MPAGSPPAEGAGARGDQRGRRWVQLSSAQGEISIFFPAGFGKQTLFSILTF